MSKILVIVESPGKIKKIGDYLGDNYIVKASYGHCRDLDPKKLSIDVENNFKPNYQIISNKQKVIKELRYLAKDCSDVILAADEDREGEMIAASLRDLLHLKNPKRIVFHEITKKAILNAVKNPTLINEDMVYAQQARRLLDRIVGYKLSPLLWKRMQGMCSAGRVQSVVVKIVIEKENKINNSISTPYFKIVGIFQHKKTKIDSVLQRGRKMVQLESNQDVMTIFRKINSDTVFKVIDVTDRESIRKAPAPYTTSTLQQDASSRLRFNVKRTMDAAQKLYEAGFITYMRTDSTNLSKDAMDACQKYIIDNYGKKYYQRKQHNKKSKGAQEAHEAIRPTKLELKTLDKKLSADCQRLYQLIWKRTMASQMSNAIMNVQSVSIDALTNDKSILPKSNYFVSSVTTVIFDGFLVLYNNTTDSDEIDEKSKSIKKDTIVTMKSLKGSQEYSKPPYRYNEASLVKELEKQGIGRPSTYASIISKIMDRKYVECKDIEGVKKESLVITMNHKFKIKEDKKEIVIGKEKSKIVPTPVGIQINNFLEGHFSDIMDTKFTAKMEKLLDKIATGDKKWYKVLKSFYQKFNPIVIQLEDEVKNKPKGINITDKLLGTHPKLGKDIYIGESKFGPYLKIQDDNDKWKFTSVESLEDITLEKALTLLAYPKLLGILGKSKVYLNKGKYGYYLSKGKQTFQLKNFKVEPEDVDLLKAKEIFDIGDPFALKTFIYKKRKIYLKEGQYGKYLTVTKKGKKFNAKVPDNIEVDELTMELAVSIINKKMSMTTKKKLSV